MKTGLYVYRTLVAIEQSVLRVVRMLLVMCGYPTFVEDWSLGELRWRVGERGQEDCREGVRVVTPRIILTTDAWDYLMFRCRLRATSIAGTVDAQNHRWTCGKNKRGECGYHIWQIPKPPTLTNPAEAILRSKTRALLT